MATARYLISCADTEICISVAVAKAVEAARTAVDGGWRLHT